MDCVRNSELLVRIDYLLENSEQTPSDLEINKIGDLARSLEDTLKRYETPTKIPVDFTDYVELVSVLKNHSNLLSEAHQSLLNDTIIVLKYTPDSAEAKECLNDIINSLIDNQEATIAIGEINRLFYPPKHKNTVLLKKGSEIGELMRHFISIDNILKEAGIRLEDFNISASYKTLEPKYSILSRTERMVIALNKVLNQLNQDTKDQIREQLVSFLGVLLKKQRQNTSSDNSVEQSSLTEPNLDLIQESDNNERPIQQASILNTLSISSIATENEPEIIMGLDATTLPTAERVDLLLENLEQNHVYFPPVSLLLRAQNRSNPSKFEIFVRNYILNKAELISGINSDTQIVNLLETANSFRIPERFDSTFSSGTVLGSRYFDEIRTIKRIFSISSNSAALWIWCVNRIHALNNSLDINQSILGIGLAKYNLENNTNVNLKSIESDDGEVLVEAGDTTTYSIDLAGSDVFEQRIQALIKALEDVNANTDLALAIIRDIPRNSNGHTFERLFDEVLNRSKRLTKSADLDMNTFYHMTDGFDTVFLSALTKQINNLKYKFLKNNKAKLAGLIDQIRDTLGLSYPRSFIAIVLNMTHAKIHRLSLEKSILGKDGGINNELLEMDYSVDQGDFDSSISKTERVEVTSKQPNQTRQKSSDRIESASVRIEKLRNGYSEAGLLSPLVSDLLDSIPTDKPKHPIYALLTEVLADHAPDEIKDFLDQLGHDELPLVFLEHCRFDPTDHLVKGLSNFSQNINNGLKNIYPDFDETISHLNSKVGKYLHETSIKQVNVATIFKALILNSIIAHRNNMKPMDTPLGRVPDIDPKLLLVPERLVRLLSSESSADEILTSLIPEIKLSRFEPYRFLVKHLNDDEERFRDKLLEEFTPAFQKISEDLIENQQAKVLLRGLVGKLSNLGGENQESNIRLLQELLFLIYSENAISETQDGNFTKSSELRRIKLYEIFERHGLKNRHLRISKHSPKLCFVIIVYLVYCLNKGIKSNFQPILDKLNQQIELDIAGEETESFQEKLSKLTLDYQKVNFRRFATSYWKRFRSNSQYVQIPDFGKSAMSDDFRSETSERLSPMFKQFHALFASEYGVELGFVYALAQCQLLNLKMKSFFKNEDNATRKPNSQTLSELCQFLNVYNTVEVGKYFAQALAKQIIKLLESELSEVSTDFVNELAACEDLENFNFSEELTILWNEALQNSNVDQDLQAHININALLRNKDVLRLLKNDKSLAKLIIVPPDNSDNTSLDTADNQYNLAVESVQNALESLLNKIERKNDKALALMLIFKFKENRAQEVPDSIFGFIRTFFNQLNDIYGSLYPQEVYAQNSDFSIFMRSDLDKKFLRRALQTDTKITDFVTMVANLVKQ